MSCSTQNTQSSIYAESIIIRGLFKHKATRYCTRGIWFDLLKLVANDAVLACVQAEACHGLKPKPVDTQTSTYAESIINIKPQGTASK